MLEGVLDFQGHALAVNTSSLGTFQYQGGRWHHLGQLTYFGLPDLLTTNSGTFPFEDLANGGFRGIQVLGTTPVGANLMIQFIERPGANHDANFQDVDQTEIMYQLYSHFLVAVEPRIGLEELELRISADGLLLDQVGDIRVVSRGKAAPGLPIPSGIDGFPLAKRRLKWSELFDAEFSIGSYREATVLPLLKKNGN